MRRREFLRAALGAVAGLAVGAPVIPRKRSSLLDGLAGHWKFDGEAFELSVWSRALTAKERIALFNQNAGRTFDCLQENLVGSQFFRSFEEESSRKLETNNLL